MQETWVQSVGWKDLLEKWKATHSSSEEPLEKGKVTDSSILSWRIPWTVYSPWGPKELDTTKWLSPSLLFPPNLCLYMCLVWVHKAPRFLAPNWRKNSHWRSTTVSGQHQACVCLFQFSSVTQLCPILWDPMNCSMPGLPLHHQLLESTQSHIHWASDAMQPSHPI